MKSPLVDYTDVALRRIITDQITKTNPLLMWGENLEGPVGQVQGGMVIDITRDVKLPDTKLVSLDPASFTMPAEQPTSPRVTVQANALKISFAEIENFRPHALNGPVIPLSKPTWIHPYQVIVPHRDFLENYDVGDEVHVAVVDHESFQQKNVTVTVTQEMIDHHSYVHFRFALNDQT